MALLRVIVVTTLATPSMLLAATNGFVVPTFCGSADSQSGYWENFTVPYGLPGNSPDQPDATTTAVLVQTNPNGFLTGTANIYNFTDANAFVVSDTSPYTLGTVVLQTHTVGAEINYGSVVLNYTDDNGPHTLAPIFRYELDRSAGGVSSLWQWDLTGLGVSTYNVTFAAAGSSLSFDAMTLDTAAQFGAAFPQQPFVLPATPANLARWMYPFNASPANRPTASVFGALGSTPDFDSRDAQFLLGWNTTNRIPAGQGIKNYLIRHARVTLTIASAQYAYTGTLRDYRSYFPTNDPRYVLSATTGSPVELFGTGFRAGFTSITYPQDGPWAADPNAGTYTNRAVYAAGFDTNGVLVDVSNNVGDDGTDEISSPFEVAPFAVGQNTNVAPGQIMPLNSQLTFDLNLDDPLIYRYVQQGLNDGNLSFMISSLINASMTGPPNYPNFYTIFSPIALANQFPLLAIDGEVVRTNVDNDADGLPDDWENFYFGSLANSASNSLTGDNINNLAKYIAGTNPTNAAGEFRVLSLQHQPSATELHFTTAPSRQYGIQWSTDLKNWQAITNPLLNYSSAWLAKTGTNLAYPALVYSVWRDTNAPGPQRFYRVSVQ
ncbi:MAG TPA: hypothetical protein VGO57_05225 [Verrucomicrobiae bacterium]